MAIDMVRFPPELSVGFVCSYDFGTEIVRGLDGGGEERTRTREMPRRYWQATKGPFTKARIEELAGFVQARAGAFHAFRFWDPKDCSTNQTSRNGPPSELDQFLGYGDGVKTTFDLRRVYSSTSGDLAQRLAPEDRMLPIHGEVDDRLAHCLGLDPGTTFNALFAENSTPLGGFSINYRARTVTFAAPPALDAIVTYGCYYDWPARIGEDADTNFETIAESWLSGSAPNIPIECVPFEKFAPETDDPGGSGSVSWGSGSPFISRSGPTGARVWEMDALTTSLTATLEEASLYGSGGPHFILKNVGANTFAVVDELTGSTIVSIPSSSTAWLMISIDGSDKSWFYVLT